MDRRRFVFSVAGAIACPLCADLVGRTALAAGDEMHWSYDGAIGLDFWGELDASYAACGAGTQQSPIDVSGAVSAKFDAGSIKWKPIRLGSIVNNGHTIQVNTPNGGHMELDGSRYNPLQFHFHHMSEHTVDGKRFPMEAHFVHKAANGDGLSVVGVFIVEGAESPVLAPIWAALPEEEGEASIEAPAGFTVLSAVRAWALCMMALEDVGGSMLKKRAYLIRVFAKPGSISPTPPSRQGHRFRARGIPGGCLF